MPAITVRLEPDTHKAFTHRLIDDEMSAQEFFSQAVQKYLNNEEVKTNENECQKRNGRN